MFYVEIHSILIPLFIPQLFNQTQRSDNRVKAVNKCVRVLQRRLKQHYKLQYHSWSWCRLGNSSDLDKYKQYQKMLAYFRFLPFFYLVQTKSIVLTWSMHSDKKTNITLFNRRKLSPLVFTQMAGCI